MKQPTENFVPIVTKLHVPQLTNRILPRHRLRLPNFKQHPYCVVSIVAPAGYGKSVLMCDWYQQLVKQRISCGWINLEQDDNDLSVLAKYVYSAFREVAVSCCQEIEPLIKAGSMGDPRLIITSILNNLAETEKCYAIFFDDFHLLHDKEVLEFVQWFFDHLPKNLLLIIASRKKLPLKVQRFKAHGELLEYNYEALAFNVEETAQYFQKMTDLHISPKNLNLIQANSEGWILALQLFSLIMKSKENVEDFIQQFSGTTQELSAYLTEVILEDLDESLREFLLKSACLERMSAELCDYIFDIENSRESLQKIYDSNLLLIALDDRQEWFRYHHLFNEFLLNHFKKSAPANIITIHTKASEWFAAHNLPYEAIHYALLAEEFDRAAELMAVFVYHIVENRGDTGTMMQWIQQLPEEYLAKYPAIWASYIMSLVLVHQLPKAENEVNKLAAFIARLSAEDPPRVPLEQILELHCVREHLQIQCDIFNVKLEKIYHSIQAWVEKWPEADPFRRSALIMSLCAPALYMHRYQYGIDCIDQALGICLQANNYFAYAWGSALKSILMVENGQVLKAKIMLGNDIQLVTQYHNENIYSVQMLKLYFAEMQFEMGDFEIDMPNATISLPAIETWAAYFMVIGILTTRIRYNLFMNDFSEASNFIQFGQHLGIKRQHIFCVNYFKYWEVIYYLQLNQLANAEIALTGINVDFEILHGDQYLYREQNELLDRAKIEIAIYRNDINTCEALIQTYIDAARNDNSIRKLLYFLLKMATVKFLQNDQKACKNYIQESVGIVINTQLCMLIVEAGQGIKALIIEEIENLPENYAALKQKILDLFARYQRPVETDTQSMIDLKEALTKREEKILQLLDSDKSNEMIANDLHISVKTLKWHLSNIYGKLDVTSRLAALKKAKDLGLLG